LELTIEQALQHGVAAHKEGKLQDAEHLYRAILQSQPLHPDANHNLGILEVSMNKAEAALPLFKAALEANPKMEQFWLSYIDALIKEKQFDNAKQVVEQAKKQGVDGDRLNSLEAKLSPKPQKSNTAGVSPSQEVLNRLRGHYQNGRYDDAERLAVSITKEFPKHQFGWKVLGATLRQAGRIRESLVPSQRSVQLAPLDAGAHNNFGILLLEVGRLDEAEASFGQAIALKPDYAEAYYNLGITLKALGRLDAAINSYRKATEINPNAEAHSNLGITLLELGRLDEAEASFGQAIALKPDHAETHSNLGVTLHEVGRLDEAEARYNQAIALKPDYAEAHYNLGITLKELGRLDEVEASFGQAIALKPDYAEAHSNLGVTLQELGRLVEAEASFGQAIALKPDYAEAHSNLGVTLQELGRLGEAEASFGQAIALKPDYAKARYNLGITLKELGRLGEAEVSFGHAIALKGEYFEAHSNLGVTLHELGRLGEAEASFGQAIALKPDYAEAHYNLGITLKELGRLGEAEASFGQAIALKPDYAEAHSNLGVTLNELGRLGEAEASFGQAIALKPDSADAHRNLGAMLTLLGRIKEAEASLRRAIALKSDFTEAWHNLLFLLNYDARLDAAELYREYEAYGAIVRKDITQDFDHGKYSPSSGRRIRVGYSSPDFRNSPCRFFMEPMYRHHDRAQFELFAYSNTKNPDYHTQRLKSYFDQWIDVTELSDEAMAERVYDDGIDIFVDMAGHTMGNRLEVFAMRPAPIQLGSPIGYGYTTGLKEMDYFMGDENLTPEGSEPYFSEQLFRLPAPSFTYEPPHDGTPDVSDPPALRKGYVTFGSLTRTIRLNDPLLKVWKKILDRVPGSRLRLDQRPFVSEVKRELWWKRLEGLGIPRERTELTCSHPHWLAYRDIDITLDCWPHNGGTTTIESLWMGVPVLSKVDRPSVGCFGAAILKPLVMEDWLAEDEILYVEKAVAFASDLNALAQLRRSLRQRLERSTLLDTAAFTQKLEAAYRQMLVERGYSAL
jgi:protein O-GlcNAc transferase